MLYFLFRVQCIQFCVNAVKTRCSENTVTFLTFNLESLPDFNVEYFLPLIANMFFKYLHMILKVLIGTRMVDG